MFALIAVIWLVTAVVTLTAVVACMVCHGIVARCRVQLVLDVVGMKQVVPAPTRQHIIPGRVTEQIVVGAQHMVVTVHGKQAVIAIRAKQQIAAIGCMREIVTHGSMEQVAVGGRVVQSMIGIPVRPRCREQDAAFQQVDCQLRPLAAVVVRFPMVFFFRLHGSYIPYESEGRYGDPGWRRQMSGN